MMQVMNAGSSPGCLYEFAAESVTYIFAIEYLPEYKKQLRMIRMMVEMWYAHTKKLVQMYHFFGMELYQIFWYEPYQKCQSRDYSIPTLYQHIPALYQLYQLYQLFGIGYTILYQTRREGGGPS